MVFVVAADHPAQGAFAIAGNAQFLREALDRAAVAVEVVCFKRHAIGIETVVLLVVDIGRDRRQRDIVGEVDLGVERDLARLHVQLGVESGGDVGRPRVVRCHRVIDQGRGYDWALRSELVILPGLRFAVVVPHVEVERKAHGVDRLPVQQQAGGERIGPAGRGCARVALLPSAAVDFLDRNARAERVGKRAADEAAGLDLVEPAEAEVEPGLEVLGRLGRNVVDRAAG